MSAWVASIPKLLGRLLRVGWLLGATLGAQAENSALPATLGHSLQPVVEKARGGRCVEEPAFMRRNHMKLLKHQRDDTLRRGIRNGKYSLKACVACHASQRSQSVNAEPGNFCQSCHHYAAVKIDCFECHANTPVGKEPLASAAENQSALGKLPVPLAMLQVKP